MPNIRKPRPSGPWPLHFRLLSAVTRPDHTIAAWGTCQVDQFGLPIDVTYGESPSKFVDAVFTRHVQPFNKTLWVVHDAYETLTSMGFWQAVKDKVIRLAGTDERGRVGVRCIVENPPTIIHFSMKSRYGVGIICDVRNWGYSLAESRTGHDLTGHAKPSASKLEIMQQLFNQLEEMSYFVSEYDSLLKALKLGDSWRMTGGSQASYGWRSNYMDRAIEVVDGSEDEATISAASYGGRCECFRVGEVRGPVFQFDVNQMYSHAASVAEFPVKYRGQVSTHQQLANNPQLAFGCCADVTVKTTLPLFPYRAATEHGKQATVITIWPIGTFRTCLAGPELWMAFEHGCVLHTHAIFDYDTARCLETWANRLWAARDTCAPGMSKVIKRIALGLYGKFGQRNKEWAYDPDDLPPDGVDVGDWYCASIDGEIIRHRVLDGVCCVEKNAGYAPQASPPVAAWVTSWGRLLLQRIIGCCPDRYYCDTDSIWTGPIGARCLKKAGLVHGGLGGLRLVGEHERVVFHGLKHYTVESNEAKAGIPKHADYLGGGRYRWTQQASFDSHMGNREYPRPEIVVRSCRGTQLYRHGVVGDDGVVSPHVLT